MLSPLKDPLRIENVENLEESIKAEDVVKTEGEGEPESKNCPSCGKYFEKDLSRHIGRVHGEKRWSCEQCDAKFIVKSNLVRHVKAVHIGELVQCDMCPHKARDKRNVIKHAIKAHPFVDVNKMKLHINVVKKEDKPKSKNCHSCGKYFEKDLSKHIRRVHGERSLSCKQCAAKFIVKGNLDRHVQEVHSGELFQCGLCPYKSKDKRYVMKHARKAHPLEDVDKMKLDIVIDREWSCKKNALKEETSIIVNERKEKEKILLKEEKQRKKTLLKLINKEVPICPHCGKEFSREKNLLRHIAFTHEGQVFACNFCSMCFKDKRSLVKHVASYHPFEKLDEWMKIKVEQLLQERKIDPIKSQKCPHCGKQFQKDFARHLNRVHGEKLPCEHCEAKFGRQDMLQRHIKKVHLLEKIQCDFCPLRYSDKRDVVEHAKRAHPSNDLDTMKFEKVIGNQFNQPKRSKSNPNNNDAIIERYKLLFGHELCNN